MTPNPNDPNTAILVDALREIKELATKTLERLPSIPVGELAMALGDVEERAADALANWGANKPGQQPLP